MGPRLDMCRLAQPHAQPLPNLPAVVQGHGNGRQSIEIGTASTGPERPHERASAAAVADTSCYDEGHDDDRAQEAEVPPT